MARNRNRNRSKARTQALEELRARGEELGVYTKINLPAISNPCVL